MPAAIRIHAHGGPDVLQLEDVAVGDPGPGELRLRQTAIGINFIDTYDRTGLYPVTLPSGIGREAAGVVTAVGPRVVGLRVGDHVAYVDTSPGAYAEERVIRAERVMRVPNGVSDRQAAAVLLKGLTVWFLLRRCYRLRAGEPVVVHAAAGGVGLLLVQWAKALGADVIAVVGSDEKARLVRRRGAAHTIVGREADLPARVRAITGGRGVPVVYDGVGRDTFMASLDCLRPRGLMVSYGNASGPVPPVAPLELSRRGSLYLTRPTLFHYIAERGERTRAARELFGLMKAGKLRVRIGQTWPLAQAAKAHRALEARATTGSSLLIP